MVRKKAVTFLALFMLIFATSLPSQGTPFHFASSQSATSAQSFIRLGYSPNSLYSINEGVPMYSTGDSLWLSSTSNSVVAAQLLSPTGTVKSSRAISTSTVSLLYTFSAGDPEGNWMLQLRFENGSVTLVPISYINPLNHSINVRLSNFSIQSGNLSLQYSLPANGAFNFEACLGSSDVNSTLVVLMPENIGSGQVLINGNLNNAKILLNGTMSQDFTFRFEMEYSYSFAGNVTGEIVSRDVTAISSNTVLFASNTTETVSLTNNTNPRPGLYELSAFFGTAGGITIEQTSALLLSNGTWVWIGGCDQDRISSLSFIQQGSLAKAPQTWPNCLYLMYDLGGVNTYSIQQFNFKLTSIQFLGSNLNANLSYLGYSVAPSRDVLASGTFNNSVYLALGNIPTTVDITPIFGNKSLQSQTIYVLNDYTVKQIVIPVGSLEVQVTNNSIPLPHVTIVAENGYGGKASTISGTTGKFTFYLPQGSYNVTVSSEGQSLSKDVNISNYYNSNLEFNFVSSEIGYVTYLLVSLLIVGFLLNVWLWFLRPKKLLY